MIDHWQQIIDIFNRLQAHHVIANLIIVQTSESIRRKQTMIEFIDFFCDQYQF